MRVLVIEDDRELAEAIGVGLRRARMAVDVSLDGRSGLQRALVNDYDVVLLDRDLPALHGDRVACHKVGGRQPCSGRLSICQLRESLLAQSILVGPLTGHLLPFHQRRRERIAGNRQKLPVTIGSTERPALVEFADERISVEMAATPMYGQPNSNHRTILALTRAVHDPQQIDYGPPHDPRGTSQHLRP